MARPEYDDAESDDTTPPETTPGTSVDYVAFGANTDDDEMGLVHRSRDDGEIVGDDDAS